MVQRRAGKETEDVDDGRHRMIGNHRERRSSPRRWIPWTAKCEDRETQAGDDDIGAHDHEMEEEMM